MTPTDEPRIPTPAEVASRLTTIRHEVSLPADSLVARGGTLRLDDLARAAETCEAVHKRPGLSVVALDVEDPQVLLSSAPRLLHELVSFTRFGRLVAKGFEVEQTGEPPHHTVWLPESGDREYWLREFRNSFDRHRPRNALSGYTVGPN